MTRQSPLRQALVMHVRHLCDKLFDHHILTSNHPIAIIVPSSYRYQFYRRRVSSVCTHSFRRQSANHQAGKHTSSKQSCVSHAQPQSQTYTRANRRSAFDSTYPAHSHLCIDSQDQAVSHPLPLVKLIGKYHQSSRYNLCHTPSRHADQDTHRHEPS